MDLDLDRKKERKNAKGQIKEKKKSPMKNEERIGQKSFQAVLNGDAEELNKMILKGFKVKSTNRSGSTALHLAASLGHKRVIEALLSANADCNGKERVTGETRYGDSHDVGRPVEKRNCERMVGHVNV